LSDAVEEAAMAVSSEHQPASGTPITRAGAELLRAELAELVDIARPAALTRVHAAMESGDGSTEASDAQWVLDRVERRIELLEARLRTSRVVTDTELRSERIAIGHAVRVRRAGGRERSYVLVSPVEGDPRSGRLSSQSPLGQALLDHEVGDVVVLEQTGEEIEILEVGLP
jgi:transcription elongation factor GreA